MLLLNCKIHGKNFEKKKKKKKKKKDSKKRCLPVGKSKDS